MYSQNDSSATEKYFDFSLVILFWRRVKHFNIDHDTKVSSQLWDIKNINNINGLLKILISVTLLFITKRVC